MALQLDPNSGLPLDPATLQALQEQNMMRNVAESGGGAAFRLNNEAMQRSAQTLFPSPAMQQARTAQQAMQGAQLTQDEGESDLDFSARQLRAQRDAISRIDPNAAAAMNTQLMKLEVMRQEQQHLKAEDQRQQTDFEAGAGKRSYETAMGGLTYALKPDTSAPLGFRVVGSFDTQKPDQTQAMLDARKKDPTILLMSPDKAAQIFSSSNTADMRVAAELAKASMGSNAPIPAEAIPGMAVRAIFDPQIQSRMNAEQKAQIQSAYDAAGVTPADIAGAKIEQKVLNAAATAEGRRDGNLRILKQEIGGMGDAVIQSMQGLTRTDFTPLNEAIMAGKKTFSDEGESKYSVAIQSLVNTYARVIAGGTGQSTEGARKEAWAMLNKAQGPAAMQSAINFMRDKEMTIVGQATDAARELIARPDNYKSLWAIQEKMQRRPAMPSNQDLAVTNPTPPKAPPAAYNGPTSFATEADVPASVPPGTRITIGGVPGTWH